MADITFYTNPMSRGRITRWLLEELGQPYDTVVLDYGTTMKDPGYLSVNPMGKVPAIVHRGRVVTEGAAIAAYLADAFPEAGLLPPPHARADYFRWLFFAAGPLEAAIIDRALGLAEIPAEKRAMVGYGDYDLVVSVLEQALDGRRFIAGDAFSAADVMLGSQVGWGIQFGTLPRRPAFEAYWAGLKDRPALRRAAAMDDALQAERTRG
ncbi:MAG: glutathione S-transferase family protein [Sphingomonadaceae bacterium]